MHITAAVTQEFHYVTDYQRRNTKMPPSRKRAAKSPAKKDAAKKPRKTRVKKVKAPLPPLDDQASGGDDADGGDGTNGADGGDGTPVAVPVAVFCCSSPGS